MNYLSVENISKSYGERVLFKNISFGIHANQKIGFVAKNGTGKTSILNIISGLDAPDTGTVITRKNLKVLYLSQDPVLDPNRTVEEIINTSDNPILNPEYEGTLEKRNKSEERSYKYKRVKSKNKTIDELNVLHYERFGPKTIEDEKERVGYKTIEEENRVHDQKYFYPGSANETSLPVKSTASEKNKTRILGK